MRSTSVTKTPFVAFANDGAALPVTDATAFIHQGGALLDADTVLECASALLATGVTLATRLFAAQVTDQIASLGLVLVGVQVDALMADGDGLLQLQSSTGLLG